MKKMLFAAFVSLLVPAVDAGEQTIKMRCEKIEGEMWCALPQKQVVALINNNNFATIELEKLRKACNVSGFNNTSLSVSPAAKAVRPAVENKSVF